MADEHRMLIGGEWVGSESGSTFDATSPSTGEVIGSIPEGTREDAQRAIAAANGAWPAWAALSAFDRAAAMRRVAAAIDERREDLAHTLTLDQGKPLKAEAHDEVDELIAYFEMAAADATRLEGLIPPSVDAGKRVFLYRVSRGVVGVISPWNWPAYGLLSAIFTRDLGRGLRFAERVRTGWVNVNEGTNYWESHLPFGGRSGSSSGVGQVGGRFSMERLTELKTIVVDTG